MQRAEQGFTLVELIVVIVLLGIIALGTTAFLTNAVEGYTDQTRRDGVAGTSRVATDRMVRELRNALPNSARVIQDASGTCLEYIPVLDATQYLSIPTISASDTLSVVPFSETPELGRVAIYPISRAAVYQTGSPGVISPTISSTPASLLGPGAVNMQLASAHQFTAHSPSQRLFVVADPVSFCVVGDRLYRYRGYARSNTQPTPASLPVAEPNRALLAFPVSATQPFRVIDATLQRNALVLLEFSVAQQGESLLIQQEVQIRNAP